MMPLKPLIVLLLFVSVGVCNSRRAVAEPQQAGTTLQQPDAQLQELTNRRAVLLQEWRRFNLEENALFGGKSKKDLRNIAQIQQKIIALDNQILNYGKLESYTEKKTEKEQSMQLQKSLYGRLDSVEALKSRFAEQIDAAKKRENTLKAGMDRQQSANRTLSYALVLVSALFLLSLFYNPLRRKR